MEMGLSASQLADRLNMSKATIYRYESGEIKDIKLPVLQVMAKALQVNPLWLSGNSKTKDTEVYRDFSIAVNDLKVFINTVKSLKYRDNLMDEQDIMFLRSWIFVIEAHFESRYK